MMMMMVVDLLWFEPVLIILISGHVDLQLQIFSPFQKADHMCSAKETFFLIVKVSDVLNWSFSVFRGIMLFNKFLSLDNEFFPKATNKIVCSFKNRSHFYLTVLRH